MARKRRTSPPPRLVPAENTLPAIFTVRAEDKLEANKIERDAWSVFLRWCAHVPEGTRVELLREGKVCAWLMSAGTRVANTVQSQDAATPAAVA